MKAIRALKIVLKDTIMSRERAYLEEAIKELEEFKNRDCSTCGKNSYLDCPCWTYSDGKITDIKYCSEWTKKG